MLRECTFCRAKVLQHNDKYSRPVCYACAVAIEEVCERFIVEQERRGK